MMKKDRFGIPRPLVDESGTGPVGISRPLVDGEKIIAELESVIGDEDVAGSDYDRIASMLESSGMSGEASVVRNIASDERRHQEELESILSTIRRETSY